MFAKASGLLAVAFVLAFAGSALAIVVDGVNDFPPATLIDADGGDTEFAAIDLGDIYVTWDDQKLYIGYGHDHDAWGGVQVGIAIVSFAGQGGPSDPWDRRIDFIGLCKPDFVAYKNIDSDYDDLVTWDPINLVWIYGAHDLNWIVSTGFDELEIPFDLIGIHCFDYNQIFIEMWTTQDNCNKGPLDLSYNDAQQLSTPTGTIWELPCDGSQDVQISCYHCITLVAPSAAQSATWSGVKNLWR